MKRIALVAAAVLACAVIPSQAFSEDDYTWWNPGKTHGIWSGFSNSTMSYGFSNSTNSQRDGDDKDDHEKHPKCVPNHHGRGKHKGERECDGSDKGKGHAWGHGTNMTGSGSTPSSFNSQITPEKNRHNLSEIVRNISSIQHQGIGHGAGKGHKNSHHN